MKTTIIHETRRPRREAGSRNISLKMLLGLIDPATLDMQFTKDRKFLNMRFTLNMQSWDAWRISGEFMELDRPPRRRGLRPVN